MEREKAELTKYNMVAQVALSRRALADCVGQDHRTHCMIDHATDSLFMQLRCHVWADEEREVCFWEHPATWWDAVKERFSPRWFTSRWPVNYTRCTVSARNIYPTLKLSLPKETHVAKFVKTKWEQGPKQ